MKWAVWVKQSGEGCGHMVGCGEAFFILKATNEADARYEAAEVIQDHTHSECSFDEAKLVVIHDDISDECDKAYRQYLSDRDERAKEKKREQIAQLKKELGEE